VTAVAFGIGSLVERSVTIYLTVKLAGAAYFVCLGVQAFRHRKDLKASATRTDPAPEPRGDLRTVLDGALVGVTNPKGVVFFAAVLPQFLTHSAGHVPLQTLLLARPDPHLHRPGHGHPVGPDRLVGPHLVRRLRPPPVPDRRRGAASR
jgi:threonine/homoserine/homoserine lactone efflux protein